MSSTTDFDVIKEIPGFKIILKAIIKSQIQQLVEQLATYTEEESVILTASVTDGSLSHLGSESGKSFLEDKEDIKSLFLGFCLKKHHKKKQEEDRETLRRASEQTAQHFVPTRSLQHASPRLSGMPGQRFATSGMRHQPYPVTRPVRVGFNTTLTSSLKSSSKVDEDIIKIEPGNDDETSNPSVSQPSSPSSSSQVKNESGRDDDEESLSTSTIPNETVSQQLAASSGTDGTPSFRETSSALQHIVSADAADADLSVKVEVGSESEMDLEITGVEHGRPVMSQGGWTPVSMAVNFNPLDAVNLDLLGPPTASQPDVQMLPSGYSSDYGNWYTNTDNSPGRDSAFAASSDLLNISPSLYTTQREDDLLLYVCMYDGCGKKCPSKRNVARHILSVHTKEKPFKCHFCEYCTSRKDYVKVHERRIHFEKFSM